MSTHANRVKMTVTSVASAGTGDITLNAASSGFRSFATAYGANATVDILITEGTAWEIARNCTYTHSGTTVSRGTLENSSTGSAVAFTSAAVVSVIATASFGNVADLSTKGAIQGLEISYSSATAIAVAAGSCAINGKLLTYAGGTLTSGSTMKDNNNATVTLGASKAYYVYAFDNAGTLEIRVQDYAAATYGGVPTWDSDYDYWKAPSVGVQARRIGKFWTDGSGNVLSFRQTSSGRVRTFMLNAALSLVAAGGATTYTAITQTPYITSDDSETNWFLQCALASGTGTTRVFLSTDGGTSGLFAYTAYQGADAGTNMGPVAAWVPYTSSPQYKVQFGDTTGYVQIAGYRHYI